MNIESLKEHFNYYLENERVFLDTERYAYFSKRCKGTYSYLYSNLLMSVCSDFESLYRSFYGKSENDEIKIDDMIANIKSDSTINSVLDEVIILKGSDYGPIQPFKITTNPKNNKSYFDWWHCNNMIKHNKINKLFHANQEIIIKALGALYTFSVYILHTMKEENDGIDIFLNDRGTFKLDKLHFSTHSIKDGGIIASYDDVLSILTDDD